MLLPFAVRTGLEPVTPVSYTHLAMEILKKYDYVLPIISNQQLF